MEEQEYPDHLMTSALYIKSNKHAFMLGIPLHEAPIACLFAYNTNRGSGSGLPNPNEYLINAVSYIYYDRFEKIDYSKDFSENIKSMLPQNKENGLLALPNEHINNRERFHDQKHHLFKGRYPIEKVLEYFDTFETIVAEGSGGKVSLEDFINIDYSKEPNYFRNFMHFKPK